MTAVSMVADALSVETRDADAVSIIEAIRSPEWRDSVESIRATFANALRSGGDLKAAKAAIASDKKRLPGVMFGGTFSRREAAALVASSGLFCADLDDLGDRLPEVRTKLAQSPHAFALFRSPSGNGLKAVFRVENAPGNIFRAVAEHVRELTGEAIDEACKDVSRLCFVSHDPEALLNPNALELAPAPETSKTRLALSVYEPETRQGIAVSTIGPIDWKSATRGLCACPGAHLHTAGNGPRDCEINLDGAPTVHCFHNSCRGIIDGINHELRSRIGAAERVRGNGTNWSQSEPGSEAKPEPRPIAVPLSRLVRPCYTQADPDELLKSRYLCRGGAALLCGPTGIGKSSFAIQCAVLWALGRPCFGICPARPLKSLFIQAENDDGDMAEMRDGVIAGLGLTQEEAKAACDNILIHREDSKTGLAFFVSVVRPLLERHRPDLLWIDPALAFIGGAAGQQETVTAFLRNQLNPLIREFNCGAIVVHHTNKPPSGKEKSNWAGSDFAYLGSGSIEWANWARAVIALRSLGSHSVFELRAAKRGSRLGWTDPDGATSYAKHIAHTQGIICWREAELSEIETGGRPKSVQADEVLSILPREGLKAGEWEKLAFEECGIKEASFHRVRRALVAQKRIVKSTVNGKWQPLKK